MIYSSEKHIFERGAEAVVRVPLHADASADACGRIIALGTFDGVHKGHAAIIGTAVHIAETAGLEPAVFCFEYPPAYDPADPHGMIISPIEDNLALFAEHGARTAFVADFPSIRDMSAEKFITDLLISRFGARGVVCGFNFRFGQGGLGDFSLLRRYFGNMAVCLPPVTGTDGIISSSRIRALIRAGRVDEVPPLLGRPYCVGGTVITGRRDGRKLGFPTANQILPATRAVPAFGVYVTQAHTADGRSFPAVSDVGTAPTLDDRSIIRVETHLLDARVELYGSYLTVDFLKMLRPERVFPDVEALIAQISHDADCARKFFEEKNED